MILGQIIKISCLEFFEREKKTENSIPQIDTHGVNNVICAFNNTIHEVSFFVLWIFCEIRTNSLSIYKILVHAKDIL